MRALLEGIRCVAFDAVGTLITPDPPVATVYHAVGCRHGSRLSQAEIARRFAEAFRASETDGVSEADWARADVLRTSEQAERDHWQQVVARVIGDVSDSSGCFAELFEHFARTESWRCAADAGATLRSLASRGYRLAVVSNFDDRLNAICDGSDELAPIELRIISSHVGYRKPSAHFYAALVRAAGCEPGEILVVGDDEINDVRGARAAGLEAVRLVRGSERPPGAIGALRELLG